jgi:hypothetical protein
VFIHKTNVTEGRASFSLTGSAGQFKDQVSAFYEKAVPVRKRGGYKVSCLRPALAIIRRSDVCLPQSKLFKFKTLTNEQADGLANPAHDDDLTAAFRNPKLVLTSVADFFDKCNRLDVNRLDYEGHVCLIFLERNASAINGAKTVGKIMGAAAPPIIGIEAAFACVVM